MFVANNNKGQAVDVDCNSNRSEVSEQGFVLRVLDVYGLCSSARQ